MKKMMKRFVAIILTLAMMCTFGVSALAVESIQEPEYRVSEYYTADGIFVEEVSFVENGEYAAVIKRTYSDGSYEAEAINGDVSVVFEGKKQVDFIDEVTENVWENEVNSSSVTYPVYTPYWYSGCEDYSQNGVALTVAIISALFVAYLGAPASVTYSWATTVYAALGSNIYSDVYFRTYRYYATRDYGPNQPTVWYNKFVTYTYSDSSRTKVLTGPQTNIYESASPL